jgi:hypothetical protein
MTTKLIRYPEERALEDAAYARGVTPTRIFALLLPIWCVEIEATVTDAEPYELIDRYLERAIAEAGLSTAAGLAGFLALDEVLVDRALRFLSAIGHVTIAGKQVALTGLGQRSVQDKVRYVITRKDRRKLYFDAFGSRPLTRAYYDGGTVTLLSGTALAEAMSRTEGPQFLQLTSFHGFRPEALTEVAGRADREEYNLPEGINEPRQLGAGECVYLPAYVIRGIERSARGARVRYLAYTQTGEEPDPHIGDLCEQTDDIMSLLETEERFGQRNLDEKRIGAWLAKRNLDHYRPTQTSEGMWRVTLPGSVFDGTGTLSLSKIGSFVLLGNDFFHLWCSDARARQRALLERADAYLGARSRVDPVIAGERIALIARQLNLGTTGLPDLRTMAAKAGKRGLAAQLARIIG